VAALRSLSQKNIMLRSKDKQWTSSPLSRRMGSISFLFLLLLLLLPVAAAGFSRSANASLAFSVCSTNKPSSKRRADPHIPLRIAVRCAFLRLFFPPLDSSSPLALRSSIEAPFDRFLETKTSVKTTKEVSSTVVTALVDIASIVLICCFQSRPSWASFI